MSSAQRFLTRVLSIAMSSRRTPATLEHMESAVTSDGATGAPATPSAHETAEWVLLLDSGGSVLEAERGRSLKDHRLGEVLERLRKSTRLAELHPSLASVIDSARRLGASGARLALIPDLLSQPFPVRVTVTSLGGGRARYRVELSSLPRSSAWVPAVVAARHDDLLMLSLAEASMRAPTLARLQRDVLPTLCEALGAEAGMLYAAMGRADDLQLVATTGHLPHSPTRSLKPGELQGAEVECEASVDGGGLMLCDPKWFGWHLAPRSPLRVMWKAALRADETVGVLVFVREQQARSALSPTSALAALEIVASRLAVLVSEQSIMSMAADLETAYAVTKAISRSLDVDSTFHQIAVSAARAVKGSSCLLFELDASLTELVVVASSDADVSTLRGLRFKFSSAEEALAALTQRTAIVVEDLMGEYGVDAQLGEALAMRSAVFVPMFVQNAPIGSLLLYSREVEREYAPADLRMVEHIADQAASAVENARLYRDLRVSESRIRSLLHRVSLMREQQRAALATIVHDEITQSMVGAIYELEAVMGGLDEQNGRSVGRVLGTLRDATRRSREVIASLRSPLLDELGLPHALRSLAADFQEETGIRCRVECSGTRELADTVESSLYRIAREALANVRKHAQAKSVRMRFACERGEARLEIVDDGRGLSPGERTDTLEHFGVLMMQEQAAACGGACLVGPGRKGGVSVVATIPLDTVPVTARGDLL